MGKCFKRFVPASLAVVLFLLCPLCAYADADGSAGSLAGIARNGGVSVDVDAWVDRALSVGMEGWGDLPETVVASPSDAGGNVASPSDLGSPGSLGGPGLLAGASEDEIERYHQSFLDYPVTLLDWPDGVPQPRFAVAAVGAAAVWVLKALLVAVGIYSGVKFTENIWHMWQDYETYLRMSGDETLLESWQNILLAEWGKPVTGMNAQYQMLKKYLKEEVQGYGTDAPHYTITGGVVTMTAGDFTPAFGPYESGFGIISSPSPVYPYICAVLYGGSKRFFFMTVSLSQYTYTSTAPGLVSNSVALSGTDYFYYYTQGFSEDNELFDLYPVLDFGFYSMSSYVDMLVSGEFVPGADISLTVTPEKYWSDLQREYYESIADTMTPPADQAAADGIEAAVSAAASAAEVAKALEGTWDFGAAKEEEGEDTYPWVPSITGWLEKLAQGIDSIKGWVSSIPDALANIWEGVQALPQSIARALEDVVVGEDDGTYTITESVTSKFPFCIPFDLVNCFRILQAPSSPPVFRVPFVIDLPVLKFSYEFVLDLSDWERPVAVIRFFLLVIYIGALIYGTRYLIKG